MRKIIVLAVLAVLLAVLVPMTPRVHAYTAAGTNIPWTILPGHSVVITIYNIGTEDFTVCTWRVIRPDGTQDDVHPAGETIIPGKSVSHTYPEDFGGNTSQPGFYVTSLWTCAPPQTFCCFYSAEEMLAPPDFKEPGGFTVVTPCFIATAAYGTPMAEQVDVLRDFRDQYLITNPVGKALVEFYYKVSPPMAEFITEHPALKPVVRAALAPAVAVSRVAVNTTLAQKVAILALLVLLSVSVALWLRHRSLGMRRS